MAQGNDARRAGARRSDARRIGLLGGTFNPVHVGHLRAALEVAEFMGLDELRLVPSARPPHRETPQASAEQRLDMVRLAVRGEPVLCVDDRELKRESLSYTVDTLESVRGELAAEDQLFLLVGWDAFCGLPTWHRWSELLEHCHILVLQRPDADSEAPEELRDLLAARSVPDPLSLSGAGGQISFIWQAPIAVSATQIRQRLAEGRSVRFLVPDAVLAYIHAHHLYGAQSLS